MESTMQDFPLTIPTILRHGARIYADREIVTFDGPGLPCRRTRFADVARRAERLAAALARLGVGAGDRVGTFGWNNEEHWVAYLAVPSMGAVLHTLNIRLAPDQIAWIANHAGDRAVLVDAQLAPLFARVLPALETVEHVIVYGGDASVLPGAHAYEALVDAEAPGFEWPAVDERAASSMCYTSGTTGNPKGVVYSHRSTYLHSMAVLQASTFGVTEHDRVLAIVPMFHANAWGLPYAAWMAGATALLPGRFLQPEPLCRLIAEERPTLAGAVPTVWNELLRHAETAPVDLSSLRLVVCGGSSVPRTLMERFQERHGVRIIQAWGMTETSPLGAMAHPPAGATAAEEMDWRCKAGRVIAGVDLRIVDDAGQEVPRDGRSVGEIEVRGPWVTASYYRDPSPEKFHDGWLRTGDVGNVDARGFVQITDRSKDVIKSGGEWVSSVEVENAIMAHPQVAEAAVIGVPDEKWQERPLACVVLRAGAAPAVTELQAFLADKIAKWWVPERWSFVAAIPRTSVGKFDKKRMRAMYAAGELPVVE
jgi:fatty-acyl-CoA synthase